MTEINVSVADDGDEDHEAAVLHEAAKIVSGAEDDINLEGLFTIANKVGAYLLVWRKMMVNGIGDEAEGFTEGWVEDAAMTLFHKFFHPWEPEQEHSVGVMYSVGGDDD